MVDLTHLGALRSTDLCVRVRGAGGTGGGGLTHLSRRARNHKNLSVGSAGGPVTI